MVAHRIAQLSRRRAGLMCRNATMIAFALSFYIACVESTPVRLLRQRSACCRPSVDL
jgi:hypothetical protein